MKIKLLFLIQIQHPTIAVFPPFSKPRTLRAIGVIFKEEKDMDLAEIMMEQARSGMRKKRSVARFKRSGEIGYPSTKSPTDI